MAGKYRVYYRIGTQEYSLEEWFNSDNLTTSNKEVLNTVLDAVPPGKAPEIFHLIDLDSDGKPTLFDEFQIQDGNKSVYGLMNRQLGQDGWFYLSDYKLYPHKIGRKILNNTFLINSMRKWPRMEKVALTPSTATINWERLSVQVNDQELFLVPWSPSPFK